jgi:hypothetical protein
VLSEMLGEEGYRVLESCDVKMRNSFPDFLVGLLPADTFTTFQRDRIDVSKAKALRLAALIDFMWENRYSQGISVSIESGFILTPILAVEYKIATNLW